MVFILLYLSGTVTCNVVQIHTVADAGTRAAKLSLINLIPIFLGGGYEFGARLLGTSLYTYGFVHRSFAVVAVLEAIVHIIIVAQIRVISWSNELQFYGLLAASMFLALVLLPLVKKRVYEVFLITHLGCAMALIYAIWQHTRSAHERLWAFPVTYISIFAITGALQLVRIFYRNMVIGRNPVRLILRPYVGDVARITLLLPRPWTVRAGERINLGVPHVGIFYLAQSHPFAISWWEDDGRGRAVSISVLFRPRSGFTRKLLDRVEPNRECGAWIDGPFGPTRVNWSSASTVGDYGHIFMVATGIGIAAQLPYIKELLDGHNKAQVCTQRISLVWQLDRVGDWESARDWLQVLVRQDNGYMLHVSVYDQLRSDSGNEIQRIGENGLIEVHSGRVNWEKQLDAEIESRIGKLLSLLGFKFGTISGT
ncbi:hypothetical protein NUU61_009367 [Penicillium alfredii]|uniref:FAD-binding FR-type domain-containing protein n=1 Tax=Penicillium alfredii TaxID=1506179 RepID=A0A9W9EMW6_9EURO|nr:uncharacterized protein NUU61_009367 [Penicillium alfredii]KAJ5084788.1 hypothetical protein NUU61_009367 [Penicillium alfredii]